MPEQQLGHRRVAALVRRGASQRREAAAVFSCVHVGARRKEALAKRAFLKGEFRGRKVVVLLQNGRGKYSRNLVLSMETRAPVTMESYAFTGHRSDREGELALFALEVKHEFMLRHEDGCLKARWAPQKMTSLVNFDFNFPPNLFNFA